MAEKTFESRFAQVLEEIRADFPLPQENNPLPGDDLPLLDLLRIQDAQERALRLSVLSAEEQASIYMLYAKTNDAGERRLIDGLVIQYAGWSLFDAGWTAFQYCFPNAALQRSLAWLWRYLRHAGDRVGPKPLYNQDNLCEDVSLSLPAGEFLSESLKLMQMSINGRSSEHLNTRTYNPDARNLERFLNRRQLIPNSMFTAMLLDLWARTLSDDALYHHAPVLLPSWSVLPQKEFAALLQRILTSPNLADVARSEMLHMLMNQLKEENSDTSAIEAALPSGVRDVWNAWLILDAIKSHYRARPIKRDFILSFNAKIKSVKRIDSATVAWNFGDFYLVDSLTVPDHSYVYPEAVYMNAIKSPATFGNLGEPRVTVRRIDNPNDLAVSESIIELSYIEPGLTKAKEFMRAKFRLGRMN